MRTIKKRVLAVCMAAMLLIPGFAVLAEEMPEANDVSDGEILQTVSGSDAQTESDSDADPDTEDLDGQIMLLAEDDIASGTNGDITWVIDASGKLTVNGTGNIQLGADGYSLAWRYYSTEITSAEINVTGMTDALGLFSGCSNMVSVDLSGFDTSNVTTVREMFLDCSSLSSVDVSSFDTSNVTDMRSMFAGCSSLSNVDVSNFDTGNVTNMWYMFAGCSSLGSVDLSNFDTGNVTDMRSMFEGCSSLSSVDVSNFDTSNVTDMESMFYRCSSLQSVDLSNFNTSNVTCMMSMFFDCGNLSRVDVCSFDTGNVTDMRGMFSGCSSLKNLDLSGFDASSVERTNIYAEGGMDSILRGCSSLETFKTPYHCNARIQLPDNGRWYNPDGSETGLVLDTCPTSITLTNESAVNNIASGRDGNITWVIDADGKLTVSGTGDLSGDRYSESFAWYPYRDQILSAEINVTGMTDATRLFAGCKNMISVDMIGFATGSVTFMMDMFADCSNLTSIDVSGFDTSNVTDMAGMFNGCSSLTSIDVSSFDTGNVMRMSNMFQGCSSLTSIDLSGFNTGNVTDMTGMFNGCSSLTELNVSSFDTGNAKYMTSMFSGCSALTGLNVSSFNTGSVLDMRGMFHGCLGLTSLDLSGFDVGAADMGDMFVLACNALTTLDTPYNVTAAVALPTVIGTTWHLPDGTEVTELPQGLDYSVVLTRSDTPTTPQITTTTPDLNMADVVRVKYVPYSYTVETNNTDPDNTVTFSLEEGRLADGLELYPATGEIYGVPLETGSFPIIVKATYSNPAYLPSYAELTLTVLDNTDANVGVATDAGYDITQPVVNFDMENTVGNSTQTLVSKGEYAQFRDVYLDGKKLTAGQDYTSEAGSTRITILNQTLSESGEGSHTLGVEFRTEEGVLKRAAQNYVVSKGSGNGDNTGDNAGDNTGDGTGDNVGDNTGNSAGSASDSNTSGSISSAVIPPAETLWQDFIIYTVEKGDSLWKIAVKFYGQGSSWRRIYEDNRLTVKNPSRLYKGQQLIIRLTAAAQVPNVPQAANPAPGSEAPSYAMSDTLSNAANNAQEGSLYRIQQGDRLWTIAHRAYGSGKLWPLIYEANRDVIADPERIGIGQVIKIPQREYEMN